MSDHEPTEPIPTTPEPSGEAAGEPSAESPAADTAPTVDALPAPPPYVAAEPGVEPSRRRRLPSTALLATAGVSLAVGVLVGVAGAELAGDHDRQDRFDATQNAPQNPQQNNGQQNNGQQSSGNRQAPDQQSRDRDGDQPNWGAGQPPGPGSQQSNQPSNQQSDQQSNGNSNTRSGGS
jgi:hypothetical protein